MFLYAGTDSIWMRIYTYMYIYMYICTYIYIYTAVHVHVPNTCPAAGYSRNWVCFPFIFRINKNEVDKLRFGKNKSLKLYQLPNKKYLISKQKPFSPRRLQSTTGCFLRWCTTHGHCPRTPLDSPGEDARVDGNPYKPIGSIYGILVYLYIYIGSIIWLISMYIHL